MTMQQDSEDETEGKEDEECGTLNVGNSGSPRFDYPETWTP